MINNNNNNDNNKNHNTCKYLLIDYQHRHMLGRVHTKEARCVALRRVVRKLRHKNADSAHQCS